jgi:hypothetical protein
MKKVPTKVAGDNFNRFLNAYGIHYNRLGVTEQALVWFYYIEWLNVQ